MVFINETGQRKKLAKFKAKEAEHLARQKAARSDYTYVDLAGVSINTDALQLISEESARSLELVPFGMVDKKLRLAAHEPDKPAVQEALKKFKENGWKPDVYVVSPTSLKKAYGYYGDISATEKTQAGEIDITGNAVSGFLSSNPDRDEAIALVKEALHKKQNTSRVLEALTAAAIVLKASDIHVEVGEKEVVLRLRIDGVLQPITSVPDKSYKLILSRIKLLSGMKLNITKEAQDGRFSIRVDGNDTEVRSSIAPSAYGESIVMRILSKSTLDVGLENLGMQPDFLKLMRREINRPKGLILNTGPTGSGKTTTLYSFLKEISKPGVKTITIESPVEYHLDGIVQTQVEPDEGYDFYDGLKAAMHQDPDIMMVGEIRDENTAKTALHAGLTGHRVLSTLHTNDAAGTFPRLVELGVNKNLIDSALNVAMAQRLLRKLCDECKQKVALAGAERDIIKTLTESIINPEKYADVLAVDHMYQASGCEHCNQTGYRGRIGVFEAIIVDSVVGDLVRENPSSREIWAHAQKNQDMLSMAQDGVLKILSGITDVAELQRVIDVEKTVRRYLS